MPEEKEKWVDDAVTAIMYTHNDREAIEGTVMQIIKYVRLKTIEALLSIKNWHDDGSEYSRHEFEYYQRTVKMVARSKFGIEVGK